MRLHTVSLPSSDDRAASRLAPMPPTEQLLVEGGDTRLALDPGTRLNKYGCRSYPDPDLAPFASSTCSVVSERGFAAAERLRQLLLRRAASGEPAPHIYRNQAQRLRRELIRLCGLAELPGVEIVLAASGTDLHRLAAMLVTGDGLAGLSVIMSEASETGSGVPAAFKAGAPDAEVVIVPARDGEGRVRQAAAVGDEIARRAADAVGAKRRVLLTVADVSKTGLLSPRLDHVLELRERFPDAVDVLIDACQFRLAPATLAAYLQHGMMVAITGSKFLTGPAFSGALMIPPSTARRLRLMPWRGDEGGSLRGDWPRGWAAARTLPETGNPGLLLRWEAALAELRAFRRLPEPAVTRVIGEFGAAVQRRLADSTEVEPVAAPGPDRRPIAAPVSWDHLPTIFPFALRPGGVALSARATERVYQRLRAFRCHLGQPVSCGGVSALRLCLSSRLIVDAVASGRQAAVIDQAMAVLDKAILLAHASRD